MYEGSFLIPNCQTTKRKEIAGEGLSIRSAEPSSITTVEEATSLAKERSAAKMLAQWSARKAQIVPKL
jgi:hypothetical protein